MQFDRSDKFITNALSVIQRYDAELYARMMADDWLATTRFDDLPADTVAMFRETEDQELYGQTAPKLCAGNIRALQAFGPASRVTINPAAIDKRAALLNVPVSMFAAAILAHEYEHVNQPQCSGDPFTMEPRAYDAGTALAQHLPAPYGERIAEFSDMNKQQNVMAALLAF